MKSTTGFCADCGHNNEDHSYTADGYYVCNHVYLDFSFCYCRTED